MRAIWVIFKREVALYFRSPIAYAVAFAVYLFLGWLFAGNVIQAVGQNLQISQNPQFQFQQPIPATVVFFRTQLLTFLMFLIAPLLTMRLLAEENREGTLEILMTLPMSESAFVIGKFLAVWAYYTVLLLLTLAQVWMLSWIGVLDYGVVFTAYLGTWLYGGAALAICMIWSALTEDQVVAAFLGSTSILILYLSDIGATFFQDVTTTQPGTTAATVAGWLSTFFQQISLRNHYDPTLLFGLVRGEDIAYYLLMIIGALFITVRIVETRRWRG